MTLPSMRRKIPYVQQLEITDCGAACLAMSLRFHGRAVRLDELRERTGTDRDGVDALALVRAARYYGMAARGVTLEIDDLRFLPRGSILHWEFNHFVVLDRVDREHVLVMDPALGKRRIPIAQVRKSFTGVALVLEADDEFTAAPGARRKRVWRYVKPMLAHPRLLAKIGITSLFVQVFALALPIVTGAVVDRVVPSGDHDLLRILVFGFTAMVAFHVLFSFVRAHLLLHLRTHLDVKITRGFIDHLVDLPYAFFLRRSAGDLMARLNSNATVREILTSTTLSTLLDGSLAGLYLAVLFVRSAAMGLVVLGLGTLQIVVLLASRRRMERLMSENLEAQARSQGYLVQLLAGIETLKVTGVERRAVERWTGLFINEVNVGLARGRLSATIDAFQGALRVASPLVVLAFGASRVLAGELSLGTMLALSAVAAGFLGPLSSLVATGLQVQLLGSYMERINDVLDTPAEPVGMEAPPLRGSIRLKSVSFRYGPLAPDVIDDVSFEIEPGQLVAIVGASGSGKSTLANLICGLYTPTAGRVLIDENDLTELDARSVRGQLGIVPQHSYLFGTSIRDNIALSKTDASLEEVAEAARLACIDADIVAMPMAYDSMLADGGASLSGGQRQRIALARALVRRPPVLVLDEATSHLDAPTEEIVHSNIAKLDVTRVVIAHRLSTIARADVIFVLDNGRLVEQGTHAQLIKRGGTYASLIGAPKKVGRARKRVLQSGKVAKRGRRS